MKTGLGRMRRLGGKGRPLRACTHIHKHGKNLHREVRQETDRQQGLKRPCAKDAKLAYERNKLAKRRAGPTQTQAAVNLPTCAATEALLTSQGDLRRIILLKLSALGGDLRCW